MITTQSTTGEGAGEKALTAIEIESIIISLRIEERGAG
jgi:hypothetical protein